MQSAHCMDLKVAGGIVLLHLQSMAPSNWGLNQNASIIPRSLLQVVLRIRSLTEKSVAGGINTVCPDRDIFCPHNASRIIP